MLHLYEGNGKGKTTAAIGLAIRMAGSGQGVLFGQFLKDGTSSEIQILQMIPQIQYLPPKHFWGFTFRMDEKARKEAGAYYTAYLRELLEEFGRGEYALLVLDEVLDACNTGMVAEELLLDFIRLRRAEKEIVVTGRNPSPAMQLLADYHTMMEKKKHPYDLGVAARPGIEK